MTPLRLIHSQSRRLAPKGSRSVASSPLRAAAGASQKQREGTHPRREAPAADSLFWDALGYLLLAAMLLVVVFSWSFVAQ